ncbi:hypothetical protein Tco_0061461, partial [Tanacetum coccineum]
GQQNRGQGNNARGAGAVGYGGAQNRVGNTNLGQARQDNAIDEDVDEQPVQDLALNVDNVFQVDDCDAYDSNVDEAPTTQTMFMANLSSASYLRYMTMITIKMLFVIIMKNTRYNELHESDVISISYTPRNTVANNLLNAELVTYKEQLELYERRVISA